MGMLGEPTARSGSCPNSLESRHGYHGMATPAFFSQLPEDLWESGIILPCCGVRFGLRALERKKHPKLWEFLSLSLDNFARKQEEQEGEGSRI